MLINGWSSVLFMKKPKEGFGCKCREYCFTYKDKEKFGKGKILSDNFDEECDSMPVDRIEVHCPFYIRLEEGGVEEEIKIIAENRGKVAEIEKDSEKRISNLAKFGIDSKCLDEVCG